MTTQRLLFDAPARAWEELIPGRPTALAPAPGRDALCALLERSLGDDFAAAMRRLERFGITSFTLPLPTQAQQNFSTWCNARPLDAKGHAQFDGATPERHLASSRALSQTLTHPLITALVLGYLGPEARLAYSRGYRIEPMDAGEYRAFQPHVDGRGRELKVMLLLTPCPPHGQRMRYWPGSHRIPWTIRSSADTRFNAAEVEQLGAPPLDCSGPAGTVFIFDTHAVHTGTRNNTQRRDTWVLTFTSSDGLFHLGGLHPEVTSRLDATSRRVFRETNTSLAPEQFASTSHSAIQHALHTSSIWPSPETPCCAPEPTPRIRLEPSRSYIMATPAGVWLRQLGTHPTRVPRAVFEDFLTHHPAHAPWIEGDTYGVESKTAQRFVQWCQDNHKTTLALEGPDEAWIDTGEVSATDSTPWKALHRVLNSNTIEADLHRDLDLPVRPHALALDASRDAAIGTLRDAQHVNPTDVLKGLEWQPFPSVDAVALRRAATPLKALTNSGPMYDLACDLELCLAAAGSVELLRTYTLYIALLAEHVGAEEHAHQARADYVALARMAAMAAGDLPVPGQLWVLKR